MDIFHLKRMIMKIHIHKYTHTHIKTNAVCFDDTMFIGQVIFFFCRFWSCVPLKVFNSCSPPLSLLTYLLLLSVNTSNQPCKNLSLGYICFNTSLKFLDCRNSLPLLLWNECPCVSSHQYLMACHFRGFGHLLLIS